MKNIKDYNIEELKQEIAKIGEKPYRAEQIYKWLYKMNVTNFDEMTDISKPLREKLKQEYSICNFKIIEKQISKDGTIKYLFEVLEENAIEKVVMEYKHGKTICVSSQVGCKMGCKFCASTGIAFIRNLTARRNSRRNTSSRKRHRRKNLKRSIYGNRRTIRQLRKRNESNRNNKLTKRTRNRSKTHKHINLRNSTQNIRNS